MFRRREPEGDVNELSSLRVALEDAIKNRNNDLVLELATQYPQQLSMLDKKAFHLPYERPVNKSGDMPSPWYRMKETIDAAIIIVSELSQLPVAEAPYPNEAEGRPSQVALLGQREGRRRAEESFCTIL